MRECNPSMPTHAPHAARSTEPELSSEPAEQQPPATRAAVATVGEAGPASAAPTAPEQPAPGQPPPAARGAADALWARLDAGGVSARGGALLASLAARRPRPPPAPRARGGGAAAAPAPSPPPPSWQLSMGALAPRRAPPAAPSGPGDAAATAAARPPAAAAPATVTRRFAGQDVVVPAGEAAAAAGSAAAAAGAEAAPAGAIAAAAGAPPPSGLDAALAALERRKGMTVLEKTRVDWGGAKAADAGVADELREHVRSSGTYLGQQDFLARAAAAEAEREREARLAAQARARAG